MPHTADKESKNVRQNPLFQMLYALWLLIKAEIQHSLIVRKFEDAETRAYKLTA